jgi:hypothetical protein
MPVTSMPQSACPAPEDWSEEVILGVDAHRDFHVAAVLTRVGGLIATGHFRSQTSRTPRPETTGSTSSSRRFAAASASSSDVTFSAKSARSTAGHRRARAGALRRAGGPRPAHRRSPSRPPDQPRAHGTTQPRKLNRRRAHLCVTQNRSSEAIKHNSDSRKAHADIRSTDAYLHADISIKERALARVTPLSAKPGRYRPPDSLPAFLESL